INQPVRSILQTFSPRNREAIQIETLIRLSDYTPSTEPVSAMIMTNKITDEPGSGVKACKKGIK
ncbi:hypothetical protein, partial [Salmonella enterica]|uniref:hypothetical protein n=1 Tax=Salmonella enterica TaxID=28901 RepID=UPI001183C844